MTHIGPRPPFPRFIVKNPHAYMDAPPLLYAEAFVICNFSKSPIPFGYFWAPANLCHALSDELEERMRIVRRGRVPFTKLAHCTRAEECISNDDTESSGSMHDDLLPIGGADPSCCSEEDNDVVMVCRPDSASSSIGCDSLFGDDEAHTWTDCSSCSVESRSSTPDYFPFVASMTLSDFPPLHEGVTSSETDSNEEAASKPLSKSARKAFARRTKWRDVTDAFLTEGESGYHSESSPSVGKFSVENATLTRDSKGPPTPRDYSSVVAGGSAKSNRANNRGAKGNRRYDQTAPPSVLPWGIASQSFTEISRLDLLSEAICHFYEGVTQSEETLLKKLRLRDLIYYTLVPLFPVCGLYVVGSSLNGFGNEKSDMDLCLVLTNGDLDQRKEAANVLKMVEKALMHLPIVKEHNLIHAKVPILRIKCGAPYDVTVDLNANNSVAIKNSHLLCYYAFFDWRLRPLVAVIKEWAKRCNINDASRSSFTSYSLVLMVIHYLQCGLSQPVLPSLQSLFPRRFSAKNDVRTLNISMPLEAVPSQSGFKGNTDVTLGELLIGFFQYYAYTYNFETSAISVRIGKLVDRRTVARQHVQWSPVCIEEPFTHSNTAHSVYDERVFEAIKQKFREAFNVLRTSYDVNELLNVEPHNVAVMPAMYLPNPPAL